MNWKTSLPANGKRMLHSLGRYKYVLAVVLVGVFLLALPDAEKSRVENTKTISSAEEDFSVEALEHKLEEILAGIDGAGEVHVMLTVQSGMKRVFAQDKSMEQNEDSAQQEMETVVISTGSGMQDTVLVQQIYPQFQGALIVAAGGGDPAVKYKLTEAVAALTGLGTDKISICKGK